MPQDNCDVVIHLVWKLVNSSFFTTFLGAVAGSLTLILISWNADKRKALADVNAAGAVLAGTLNTLLNLKRQFSKPLVDEFHQNFTKFQEVAALERNQIFPTEPVVITYSINLKKYFCPKFVFDIALNRIVSLSSGNVKFIEVLMQSKKSQSELETIISAWNDLADSLKNVPEEKRKSLYFGLRDADGVQNTIYVDTVMSINSAVNDALYFANRALTELEILAKKSTPFWFKKKIFKFEILGKENIDLMPPQNFKDN
jgi:hypothetical protein